MNEELSKKTDREQIHPACILCGTCSNKGVSVPNGDQTYVKVCDRCFEGHWQEIYQEPGKPAGQDAADPREEQGQC